jgi:hypothetical protein
LNPPQKEDIRDAPFGQELTLLIKLLHQHPNARPLKVDFEAQHRVVPMAIPVEPLAITRRSGKRGATVGLVIHPNIHLAPGALDVGFKRDLTRL